MHSGELRPTVVASRAPGSGLRRLGFVLAALTVAAGGGRSLSAADVTWSQSNATGAWLTAGNWSSGAVPASSDVARFGATGNASTTAGINFDNATNNGPRNQIVGAIEILSSRSSPTSIGNSTTAKSGTLTLAGATVNSLPNVILRNAGSGMLTLVDSGYNGGGQLPMAVALGNATDNVVAIDGGGGITIASVITGTNRTLTVGGTGSGALVLSNANTYSGTTRLSAGTLRAGTDAAFGSGLLLLAGGTLTGTGAVARSFANDVSIGGDIAFGDATGAGPLAFRGTVGLGGATRTLTTDVSTMFTGAITNGSFTKAGAATLSLTGASSGFTGTATVAAGRLQADGILGGIVSVSSGATLAGSGTVGGVSIASGATLSPGSGPGLLTTGNMTWAGGGAYAWQLHDASRGAGAGYDTIVGGTLTIAATAGDRFTINLWTLSSIGPDVDGNALNFSATRSGSFTLGTFASISGFSADAFTVVTAAANGTGGFTNPLQGTFSVTNSGNSLWLLYTHADPTAALDFTGGSSGWSVAGSWAGNVVPSGTATITFSGPGGTATNDVPLDLVSALTFTGSAGGYTVAGDRIPVGAGGITNDSPNGHVFTATVALAAPASFTAAAAGLAFSGTVDTAGNALTVAGGGNVTLAAVTGTAAFMKTGSGTATLTAAIASPTVTLAAGTLLVNGSNLLADSAAVTVSDGMLDLRTGSDTVGTFTISGGVLAGSGTLTAATYALRGGTVAANLGAGTLTAASGATTLAGMAAATGVTISGGTLTLASGNALGPGPVTLSAGGLRAAAGQTIANAITIGGTGGAVFAAQNFDGLGGGLPAGWTTGTGAAGSSLGTAVAFAGTPVAWGNTSGQFNNYAAATGLTAAATATAQSGSADRALGVRQTSTFGDPGATFTYTFSTAGRTIDSVSLDLMILDAQNRSTTWSVQYGSGTSPASFTTLGTWTDPGVWGTTRVTFSGTAVSGMSNLAAGVFRVVALAASSGSNSRDSIGIDNFRMTLAAPVVATLGGDDAASVTYSGGVAVTGTAALTAAAGGTATFVGGISGVQGSVTKIGAGVVVLSGSNSYAGATTVAEGVLEILGGGRLAGTSTVTVAGGARLRVLGEIGTSGSSVPVTVDGILSGNGRVFGVLGGSGSIDPGGSPGILTCDAVDPTSGLDHAFEFTALAPNYTTSGTDARNDLVHLTSVTPFSAALSGSGGNMVNLYFNTGSFAEGLTFVGGFFADHSASLAGFLAHVERARFSAFVADPGGDTTYRDVTYRSLTDWNATRSQALRIEAGAISVTGAAFLTGTTNGFVTTFMVVPEPSSLALAGLGLAAAGWGARRTPRRNAVRRSGIGPTRRIPAGARSGFAATRESCRDGVAPSCAWPAPRSRSSRRWCARSPR